MFILGCGACLGGIVLRRLNYVKVFGLILILSLVVSAQIPQPDLDNQSSNTTIPITEESKEIVSEKENDDLEIKEDEILVEASDELYGDDKQVTIKGDVNIRGTDFTAKGNVAVIDLENNTVYFSGGVNVIDSSKEFIGEELIYNYKTKVGTIKGVKGNIENKKFKDEIYLYGHEMSFKENYLKLEGGCITTCDLDTPHYHIAANTIEIYEDDKMILRNLYYKEGSLPLLYLPYWQVSLKEKKNYWKFPKFGTSYKEGFYVKLAYVYTLNNYNKGEINFDYMTKLGIGQGVQHAYSKDKNSLSGRYYVIYSPEKRSFTLFDTSGSFMIDKDKFQFSGTAAYKDDYTEYIAKHLRNTSLNYRFTGNKYSGNLRLSYIDEISSSVDKEELKFETSHSYRFSDAWRANINANFKRYQKDTLPWITVLSYDGTINYTAKYLTGTLRWQQEDKSQEEKTTYSKLYRQPEIILRSRNVRVVDWPLVLEATVGHYKEEPKKIESDKLSFRGVLGRKTFPITKDLSFNVLGEGQGTVYDLQSFDPYVLSWRSVLGLSYSPTKNWRFAGDYTKRDVYGNSPFSFDKLSNIHSLDFSINNTIGFVTTETKTGYDIIKSSWKNWDNIHRINYKKLSATLEHSYKLVPFEPIKFAGNIRVEPTENFYLQGRLNYTKENQEWKLKDLNGKGELKFGAYNLSGEATFSPQNNKYTTLKLTLGKDLHCRRLDFTYDHVNKAVWLEFRINAIGDKPTKVKMSDKGVEFTSDMLSSLSSGN